MGGRGAELLGNRTGLKPEIEAPLGHRSRRPRGEAVLHAEGMGCPVAGPTRRGLALRKGRNGV